MPPPSLSPGSNDPVEKYMTDIPDDSLLDSGFDATGDSLDANPLYPGLGQAEINLRRTQTRASMINELYLEASRAVSEQKPDTVDPEVAPPLSCKAPEADPELVTWAGADDPAHPRNWTRARKWKATLVVSSNTLMAPFSSSVISLATPAVAKEFHIDNTVVKTLTVSIFVLAWTVGPLFAAPLSEMYGRKLPLNVSIFVLLGFNIGCAFSQNTAQLLVFRFLGGLAGCTPLSVGAGVLGDCFNDDDRTPAMGLYSLGPTLGPSMAPIIAGFIVENLDWRWVFYVCSILNGVVAIAGLFLYEETYPPILLKRKAARLRKELGNPNWKCIYEIADGETVAGRLYVNFSRPLMLLLFHPMVFGLGLFMAFVYGFSYLMIVTIPTVWMDVYGFNEGISGLLYLPMAIGYVIGIAVWTPLNDWNYKRLVANNGGVSKPEFRLPLLLCSGVLVPVALIWYGWSAQRKLHWIMPSIGMCLFSIALIAVFQTIQGYLIHMNPIFAASSIGAASLFRSFFGFGFPLFAHAMYAKLGYGWGNTMCGFLALALGIPFPLFVIARGEQLRLWANRRFEREIALRRQRNLKRLQRTEAQAV